MKSSLTEISFPGFSPNPPCQRKLHPALRPTLGFQDCYVSQGYSFSLKNFIASDVDVLFSS